MSGFDFQRCDLEQADAPWRPLDRALLRWVLAHGGSPELARLAAWTSLADGEGDTALPLLGEDANRRGLACLDAAQLQRLRGEPLVGAGDRLTPFVLDPAGRLYLWRNHADEMAVAVAVNRRRAAAAPVAVDGDGDELDALFQHDRSSAVQRQREAVRAVAGRRLFVLTGGPGTGKTTTVLRMLLMLQRHVAEPVIQVAAPTGKAAQRLLQSLRLGKQALRDAAQLASEWHALLDRIPDREAQTMHRLLGYDPRRQVFTRHRDNPLAADIVVVDEASMVDLAMLRALLDAVRPQATLLLVGDADQLTSVAAGSVLMDLVGVLEAEHAPELVRLEHSFRAEQPLVAINQAVRRGDLPALRTALAGAEQATRHVVDEGAGLRRELSRWTDALAQLAIRPTLPAAGVATDANAADADPASAALVLAALQALAQRQLLCALREGGFGALAANAWIEHRLRQQWNEPAERTWYPGRAVLITRNDYATRLFNGDVGLCLADADGRLRVWFETTTADGQTSVRSFSPGALPAHEGAFAITIHKSQGSEYEHVAVLLPPDPEHRILSRQLLYTGLSRARQVVELWAGDDALAAAVARPIRRAGGLADRLVAPSLLPSATLESPCG